MASVENKSTTGEVLAAVSRYCAYQERCILEVTLKLRTYISDEKEINRIISILIKDGFINEARFCHAYVLGKFRKLKWGKNRIRYGLVGKGVPEDLINESLNNIPDDEYELCISRLAESKKNQYKEKNILEKKMKISKFLISKGFEADKVRTITDQLIK